MAWEEHKPFIYDKWKKEWYKRHPNDIAEYSWNYLFNGGKEIRARLFCELWRYLSPDLKVQAELAFAIECIHVASLIIDDSPYMDNAESRRNKQTLHRKFSIKKAFLLCYDVMDMARTIWISHRPNHISSEVWNQLIKSKLDQLMIGQWLDIEKTGSLYELSSLKTGILFELVTETVALCIGLDTPYWRKWGNQLGVLFQWMDDWNDRDEDRIQQNRNAFLEDYQQTHHMYRELWFRIKNGIGNGWFLKPFGKYMNTYFTSSIPFLQTGHNYTIPINDTITQIMELPEFDRTRLHHRNITYTMNGKDILSIIFHACKYIKEDDRIKTDLWNIPESEWHTIPEINEWIEIINERTGLNLRPEIERVIEYFSEE